MNPVVAYPTDLHAPGAIDQLIAFHRQTFGGWTMTETPPVPGPPAATPPVAAPPAESAPPAEATEPTDLASYQDLVTKLRDEVKQVKSDRTPQDEKDGKVIAGLKRQLESAQSPEDVKKEMAQTIAKALGLAEDEPIDPAKLTENLTTAQADAKQARVELAVFRNATTAGGDPAALLDSTSFLKSLEGIDPSDEAAVQAAITTAVGTNQRLGAATEPRTPAPNPAQGTGSNGAPGLDDQIAKATQAGDIQLAIALKQQRAAEQNSKP